MMKSFKQYLEEQPQLIPNLDNFNLDSIEKLCKSSMNNKTSDIVRKLDSTSAIYHLDGKNSSGIYFLGTQPNKIEYFVKYEPVKLIDSFKKEKAIRQILISRRTGAGVLSAGVAADIFWNILFPKFGCIVSDNQQTKNGISFWEYRIKEALEKQLTVSMIDTNDKKIISIKSLSELKDLTPNIWGTSKWFQRIVIVIH